MWVQPNNTSHPSNVIFVNEVDSTGNETNVKSSDSLFSSGQWISRYFQYKQWHGPHLFSLFFNHKQQKVTGSGEDDVGEFSIDGIYSLNTRRIALTSTGNESNVDNLDSLFSSGQWMSRYFQYKQWHGPHLFSLFFNHKQQKVTGSGEDDVGEFSIDGIYSLNTRRIALTKKYQKGTGNSSQNLGHTVIIQIKWDSQKQLFDGKWYVKTNKYQGEDRFELQFDQSTIVVDKQ
ncbi:unnamed protein product [Adineta steineri]|uniref:Uncharacterized protein n=1 Tax=Adineta steineri TaxID=433720 RepID=A0A815QX77_9BILA|nr:unnamed protein product [Adineta steineri]